MRGLRRVAHAPPWPGDHDRLACCARVRGLRPPPPFAAALRSALTPAATPRVRGLFGSQDEWTPKAWCRINLVGAQLRHQEATVYVYAKSYGVPNRPSRGDGAERSDRAKRDERLAPGGGSPLTRAQHASRACSAGAGGACAACGARACAGSLQQTLRCITRSSSATSSMKTIYRELARDLRVTAGDSSLRSK